MNELKNLKKGQGTVINAEKSWDCLCHGSRFNTDGKVIQSPATRALKKISLNK